MNWKRIKGLNYINYYVSDTGLVKNEKGHLMALGKNRVTGYSQTRLAVGRGKGKTFRIHRLVAETFIPNPNNYPEINHKNEVRTDNRVENLEWCTHKYNNNYGNHTNRLAESQRNSQRARRIPILVILPNGSHKYARSLREASEITGWSRNTIQTRLENPHARFDKNTYKFVYASNKKSNNKAIKKYSSDSIDHTKKSSYTDVINKLKQIHPNLIITSGIWGTHETAHFRCLKCGYEFDKTPNEVFAQKYGCTNCANKAMAKTKATNRKTAEKKIKDILYDNLLLGDDYVRSADVCHFTCRRCGKTFTSTLTRLLNNAKKHGYVSNGCQSCSKSRSVTITNLKKYGHDTESIRSILKEKGLDWCPYNPK